MLCSEKCLSEMSSPRRMQDLEAAQLSLLKTEAALKTNGSKAKSANMKLIGLSPFRCAGALRIRVLDSGASTSSLIKGVTSLSGSKCV